jgi:hypothetical protein
MRNLIGQGPEGKWALRAYLPFLHFSRENNG